MTETPTSSTHCKWWWTTLLQTTQKKVHKQICRSHQPPKVLTSPFIRGDDNATFRPWLNFCLFLPWLIKKWLQILRWQCCLISSGAYLTLQKRKRLEHGWWQHWCSVIGNCTPGLYCFIACSTRCPCKCRQGLPAHTNNPVNGWESILKLPGNFYFNSKNILTEILLLYGEQ